MYKKLKLIKSNLTESPDDDLDVSNIKLDDTDDTDDTDDMEDIVDTENNQEENPISDEETNSYGAQLDELREVLPDLNLNLYQIINKENENDVIYIIGKVSDDSDDILMLVDTKPTDINNDSTDNIEDTPLSDTINEDTSDLEDRFDYVLLPNTYEEINTLNPRYGEGLNPDHQAIMDYLMNCLVEINPNATDDINNQDLEYPNTDDDKTERGEEINNED